MLPASETTTSPERKPSSSVRKFASWTLAATTGKIVRLPWVMGASTWYRVMAGACPALTLGSRAMASVMMIMANAATVSAESFLLFFAYIFRLASDFMGSSFVGCSSWVCPGTLVKCAHVKGTVGAGVLAQKICVADSGGSSDGVMKAIQVKKTGGPEVLTVAELSVPKPKENEAVVQIKAIGVN